MCLLGIEGAAEFARGLKGLIDNDEAKDSEKPGRVYSSGLMRALQVAEQLHNICELPVTVHPPLHAIHGAETTETMSFKEIKYGPEPNSQHNCANPDFHWKGIPDAKHTGDQYWPNGNPENPLYRPDLKTIKGVPKEHFHLELSKRLLGLKDWMKSLVEQYHNQLQSGIGHEHAVVIVTHSSLIKQLTRVLRLSERHMTPSFVNAIQFTWTYGEEYPDLFLMPPSMERTPPAFKHSVLSERIYGDAALNGACPFCKRERVKENLAVYLSDGTGTICCKACAEYRNETDYKTAGQKFQQAIVDGDYEDAETIMIKSIDLLSREGQDAVDFVYDKISKIPNLPPSFKAVYASHKESWNNAIDKRPDGLPREAWSKKLLTVDVQEKAESLMNGCAELLQTNPDNSLIKLFNEMAQARYFRLLDFYEAHVFNYETLPLILSEGKNDAYNPAKYSEDDHKKWDARFNPTRLNGTSWSKFVADNNIDTKDVISKPKTKDGVTEWTPQFALQSRTDAVTYALGRIHNLAADPNPNKPNKALAQWKYAKHAEPVADGVFRFNQQLLKDAFKKLKESQTDAETQPSELRGDIREDVAPKVPSPQVQMMRTDSGRLVRKTSGDLTSRKN